MLASATRRVASQRAQLQRTFITKKNLLSPLQHVRHINTKDFLQSHNFAYTIELGRELTESVMAKYFALDDNKPAELASSLSPHTIASMVDEITKKDAKLDYATGNMLTEQAILTGAEAVPQIERLMNFYMDRADVIAAALLLRKCPTQTIHISERTCHRLLSALVENCNWDHAFVAAMYMLSHDYRLPHNAVFCTLGGLVSTSGGVAKAMEMIKVIIIKKRSDVGHFSYAKVARFSQSMNGTHQAAIYREPVPSAVFEEVLAVTLSQLRLSGWFSFKTTKLILALTVAANHQDLAADFVRHSIKGLMERGQATTAIRAHPYARESGEDSVSMGDDGDDDFGEVGDGGKVDVVSLLRAYSQGDGVVKRYGQDQVPYTPTTLAVLEMCWLQPYVSQLLEQGPMRCLDLFTMYWVLAHRCRDVVVHQPEYSKKIPLPVLDAVHAQTQALYDQLMDFWNDESVKEIDLAPRSGYERRTLRILCDAFGFKHRFVHSLDNKGEDTVVRVYKHASTAITGAGADSNNNSDEYSTDTTSTNTNTKPYVHITPPSLTSLLEADILADSKRRQFDGLPLYFANALSALRSLDDEKLCVVVHRLSNAMLGYPSVSWLLLLIDVLYERNLPLPLGLLRNGVKMCRYRNDIYGLLEVLHAAHREQARSLDSGFQNHLYKLRFEAKYQSGLSSGHMDRHAYDEMYGTNVSSYGDTNTTDEHNNTTDTTDTTTDTTASTASTTAPNYYRRSRNGKPLPQIDFLSAHDWNRACMFVFRTQHANIASNSRREVFAEVMQLMGKCGVNVSRDSIKTLLDFLVYTRDDSDHLWSVIQRIAEDEEIAIDHRQCVALTAQLNRRLSPEYSGLLRVNSSSAKQKNYLFAFPTTMQTIAEMVLATEVDQEQQEQGDDTTPATPTAVPGSHAWPDQGFRERFKTHWANLHFREGREGLYTLLDEAITGSVCRTLSDPALHRQRDALTLVCMYTAYLVTAHDDEATAAFALLAGAEKMHLNAIAKGYRMVEGNVHKYKYYSAVNSSKRSGTGRQYSSGNDGEGEEDFEVGDYDTTDNARNNRGSSYSESNERFSRASGSTGGSSNNKYRNGTTSRRNDYSGGGNSRRGRYSDNEYDDTDRFARHDNKYKYKY